MRGKMGNYTIIAEAGNALVRLLRRELVPDIIRNSAAIGLASPADRGDISLCVHLYDVSESEIYRISGMIPEGADSQRFPPVHLSLSYLITAFSSSDVKFRSEEEQRILGRVTQILRDHPVLDLDTMEFGMEGGEDRLRIEMLKADMEEKLKVWSFPDLYPRLSLFYRMDPLALESARTRNIKRVQEMEFQRDVTAKPWDKLFRKIRS